MVAPIAIPPKRIPRPTGLKQTAELTTTGALRNELVVVVTVETTPKYVVVDTAVVVPNPQRDVVIPVAVAIPYIEVTPVTVVPVTPAVNATAVALLWREEVAAPAITPTTPPVRKK